MNPFRYIKTSPEVIRLAVPKPGRLLRSLWNIDDLLQYRAVDLSHETVRFWWNRFGQKFAAVHSSVHNHLNLDRLLNPRGRFKENRHAALVEWRPLAT